MNWRQQFVKDERGSATIETLIWVPMFVYLLVLITDVSLIFYGKAQALRIIQDGNRALSVRHLNNTDEAEAYVLAQLATYTGAATVNTSIADGMITTVAVMPASDLMAIGSIPGFSDNTLNITAQHFLEQEE